MKKTRKSYYFLVVLVFVLFSFFLIRTNCLNRKPSEENIITKKKTEKEIRPLDGLYYFGNYKFLPIAVIYDNLENARPQAGLNFASIIYELPVEGGITRFLAIFDSTTLPERIGPIRSARSYFAEIADEYKGIFIHAGGSPDVLKKIKTGYYNFFDFDEISSLGIYFWRDYSKKIPHNLYLNVKKFLNSSWLDLSVEKFNAWKFEDENPERGKVEKIEIDYKEPVEWRYNNFKNQYFRYQNGKKFIDENGEQISTENVIIQFTDISVIDEKGRKYIRMIGEGKALIFKNGKKIDGFWRKFKNGRTRFFNEEGEEIKFNRGRIWVEVVSKNTEVKF